MERSGNVFDEGKLQQIFESALIDQNSNKLLRCRAVLEKMMKLFTLNKVNLNEQLLDNLTSTFLSYVLESPSDKEVPVGIIEFGESADENAKYEVYPCSEIMNIVAKYQEGEKEFSRMIRIHTKHGQIFVPARTSSNEKNTEKNQRRQKRFEMFLSACKSLLTDDNAKLSKLDKSEQWDSEIIKWAGNFVSNIEHPKKYPDFFIDRKRKQVKTENQCSSSAEKVLTPSEGPVIDAETNKTISASDVCEMIMSIDSSSNSIPKQRDSSNSKVDHVKTMPITQSMSTSYNQEPQENSNVWSNNVRLHSAAEAIDHNSNQEAVDSYYHDSRAVDGMNSYIPSVPVAVQYPHPSDQVVNHAQQNQKEVLSNYEVALVEGEHYACWFDSQNSDSKFCYVKLQKNPSNSTNSQHVPYKPVKSGQKQPNVVRIPFETSSVDFVRPKIDFVNAMKGTNVKNTHPVPTNLHPPWNPNYENLFIMKAGKSVPIPQVGGHMLTRVKIWKYAHRKTSKSCVFHLRTPGPN